MDGKFTALPGLLAGNRGLNLGEFPESLNCDIFGQMQTLCEKLFGTTRFLVAAELVSVRGSMAESGAIKIRTFANELVSPSRH